MYTSFTPYHNFNYMHVYYNNELTYCRYQQEMIRLLTKLIFLTPCNLVPVFIYMYVYKQFLSYSKCSYCISLVVSQLYLKFTYQFFMLLINRCNMHVCPFFSPNNKIPNTLL